MQLYQCQLNLRVAGISVALTLIRPKHRTEMICQTPGDAQHLLTAGRLVIGYSRFDEMSRAVKLVIIAQIRITRSVRDHAGGIEVSVLLLRPPDQSDHIISMATQRFIRTQLESIGNRFQPFVQIAVLKRTAIIFARLLSGGDAEIADSAAVLHAWNLIVEH